MLRQISFVFLFVFVILFIENKQIYSEVTTEIDLQVRQTIPVLDLNEYKHGDEVSRSKFIQEVAYALHEYGFFALENSDVDEKILKNGFNSAISFFNHDHSYKLLYQNKYPNRGYKSFNLDNTLKTPDLQEYYHIGRNVDDEMLERLNISLINPNVWPDSPTDFQTNLSTLYNEFDRSGQYVLEACSLAMGENVAFLSKMTEHSDSILRFIHYLDVPSDMYQNLTWKAAHKDPNLITFIYGITSAGLEIQRPDGSWLKVEYIPGQVIVSGSNMLENLSNGLFKSTPHRVMTYRNHSRYAIPFFYHVRRELDISPTEKAIERTGGKALYPSMTAQKALERHHWFGGKAK